MITMTCDRCGHSQQADPDDPTIRTTEDYRARMRALGFNELICVECASGDEIADGVLLDVPADSLRTAVASDE